MSSIGRLTAAAVQLERDLALAHRLQASLETACARRSAASSPPHLLAGKALEMRLRPQHPIQARRGHFQACSRPGIGSAASSVSLTARLTRSQSSSDDALRRESMYSRNSPPPARGAYSSSHSS